MKKRLLTTVLAGLAVAALAAGLSACSSGSEEIERPFDYLVTFNYNTAEFEDANCASQYLGVKAGAHLVAPGYNKGFAEAEVAGHYIEGWYTAETDADGNFLGADGSLFRMNDRGNTVKTDKNGILLDAEGNPLKTGSGETIELKEEGTLVTENGSMLRSQDSGYLLDSNGDGVAAENGGYVRETRVSVALDKKWNFETDTVSSDMTLFAHFIVMPRLIVVDSEDPSTELRSWQDAPGKSKGRPTTEAPVKEGHTFYEYYTSADCDEVFDWKEFRFTAEDTVIYAKFIVGNFRIVTTTSAFAAAIGAGNNIYLDDDLDFGVGTAKFPLNQEYGGEINGNGHTVSNIKVELKRSPKDSTSYGLFKSLKSSAYIHDIKFENVTATFTSQGSTTSSEYIVALFAEKAEAGAKLESITFTNCKLEIGTVISSDQVFFDCTEFIGVDEGAQITDCDTAHSGGITITGDPRN